MSDEDAVRAVLEPGRDNVVFRVEADLVWVSGVNHHPPVQARSMKEELDDAGYETFEVIESPGRFGGARFGWSE